MKAALFDTISLKSGGHARRKNGVCATEAIAWMAGERHSDHPACLCSVIGAFLRSWNDGLPDDSERNRLLKPLLANAIGTADPAKIDRRAFLCVDWLARVFTPPWLDMVDALKVHAEALRRHPEITSWEHLAALTPVLVDARKASDAAWAAASSAAWPAASDAASDAASSAASDAAWDAAWAAARAAARAAASDAAWAAARAAAWSAARAAASDAAWAAARAAASDAARAAMEPTKIALQESAADLVRRMCAV